MLTQDKSVLDIFKFHRFFMMKTHLRWHFTSFVSLVWTSLGFSFFWALNTNFSFYCIQVCEGIRELLQLPAERSVQLQGPIFWYLTCLTWLALTLRRKNRIEGNGNKDYYFSMQNITSAVYIFLFECHLIFH